MQIQLKPGFRRIILSRAEFPALGRTNLFWNMTLPRPKQLILMLLQSSGRGVSKWFAWILNLAGFSYSIDAVYRESLLRACFNITPTKRPTAQEIVELLGKDFPINNVSLNIFNIEYVIFSLVKDWQITKKYISKWSSSS